MAAEFQRLFSPIRIGKREVRNRIVFQAHQTGFSFGDDRDSGERYIAYQEARARGGVGMIVLENWPSHASTDMWGRGVPSHELLIEKYRKMANAVHKHGATVLQQVGHQGREVPRLGAVPQWSFSPLPSPSVGDVPHEMTIPEIHETIDAYARRAQAVKAGGLDGVELHGTHGYLLQQSWSPFANQRQDEYGGDFQRRLRFAIEVIAATRDVLGPDLILGIRVSGDDWMEDGIGTDGIIEVCKALVATGKLDYINVCGGGQKSHYTITIGSTYIPPAALVPYAAAFKEAFPNFPIWVTDRIKDPAEAEAILAREQANMVGMVRALIADPDLPKKAQAGDLVSIRECLSCSHGCADRFFMGRTVTCTQNAQAGLEYLGDLKPAETKKRVLVVGGGPAGLEAAHVAALRGHDVTLCEASDDIGGQIRLAVKAPTRSELDAIVRNRRHELARLDVRINLRTEVGAEQARELHPDAIVVATGALPFRPPIQGADQAHVLNTWDVLSGSKPIGESVVLIDLQAENESMSVADFLLEQGKRVEIVTPYPSVGQWLGYSYQEPVQQRLLSQGAKFTPHTSAVSIGKNSIDVCRSNWSSEKWTIEAVDTVVIAGGYRANDSLAQSLAGIAPELYMCGDCNAPGRALQAVADGYRVGALL